MDKDFLFGPSSEGNTASYQPRSSCVDSRISSSGSETNGFPVRALATMIAAARELPELPLTKRAEAVWQSTYPLLLDRKPWLFAEGHDKAFAEATRWARLVAAESQARVIDDHALKSGLLLWQYADSREHESSNYGIVCDGPSRRVYWDGKTCDLKRAPQRFKLFRAFVKAKGARLSGESISQHLGKPATMTDAAIRRAVSYLRQSLRDADMAPLADAIKPHRVAVRSYVFRLKTKSQEMGELSHELSQQPVTVLRIDAGRAEWK